MASQDRAGNKTMPDAYGLSTVKTMDDINEVIDFIRARVTPLRDKAPYDSDEFRAFQALLDMTTVAEGAAGAEAVRGDSPAMLHFHFVIAARQWRNHSEFLPEWNSLR